jgi:hypothetical protein
MILIYLFDPNNARVILVKIKIILGFLRDLSIDPSPDKIIDIFKIKVLFFYPI